MPLGGEAPLAGTLANGDKGGCCRSLAVDGLTQEAYTELTIDNLSLHDRSYRIAIFGLPASPP